ncbi:hypothetical protein [Gimesia fumaroli]|nr:hypothetical protein [Gimesia fumaroli]
MSTNPISSRQQFEQYKAEFHEKHGPEPGKKLTQRERSSWDRWFT